MARAVAAVGSFLEQPILGRIAAIEPELHLTAGQYPALNRAELELQNPAQIIVVEWLEHDRPVDPAHELRREVLPSRLDRGTSQLFLEARACLRTLGSASESDTARRHGRHLVGAKVGGHDDDGAREIDAPIVT